MDLFIFKDYTPLEIKIFNGVKSYFEKLPPYGSDDYKNGFSDLVSQFGAGGQDYLVMEGIYENLIESTIVEQFNNQTGIEKNEIQHFYEMNFLDSYYDHKMNSFAYSTEDLTAEIVSRFKCWMDDNFSLDDLLDEYEEDDEEEELQN